MKKRISSNYLMHAKASTTAAVALLFTGAVATSANGQTTTSSASSDQLVEIVVHAQRIDESLQRVPVSVNPISGDELAARKLNDLTQITAAVPSMSVGVSNSFSLRGVGSLVLATNLDASVGVSVDNVSLGVPINMSNAILDDVSQIEVLTGPQGLLFGRNASAGLINIVSNKPVIGQYEGNVSAEFDDRDTDPGGHFGTVERATLNIPVSENSALRLNVSNSYQDPLVKNVAPNTNDATIQRYQERAGIKAKYLWEPSDNLSIYLIGDYSRERGVGGFDDYTYRSAGKGIEAVGVAADGITPGPANLYNGIDGDLFDNNDTGGVSLNVEYNLSPTVAVSNIVAWRGYNLDRSEDYDFTSLDMLDLFATHERYNQYSDELRVAFHPTTIVDGQAGLYGFYQDQNVQQHILGAVLTKFPNFLGNDLGYHRTGRSLAAFGQGNLHVTDQLTLIAGARVTNDDISINLAQNFGHYIVPLFGPTDTTDSQRYSHTNISYKVGAQYQLRPDVMAYAAYSTGYKGPGFNQNEVFPRQDLTILPETVRNIELGIKTEFFDHRLRLDFAGFIEHFHDLQVQEFNTQAGTFVVGNANGARTRGIEFTGVAKPLRGLTVNFGATFLDAKFTDFPGDQCYIGQATCLANGTFNAAGVVVPNSAKFTSTMEVTYEFPLNAGATGFVESNFLHRSSVNYSTDAAPFLSLGNVNTLGLSAGAKLNNGLDLTVFCRDCTDQIVPSSLYVDSIDSLLAHVNSVKQGWNYNSVRTIGVTASYKF